MGIWAGFAAVGCLCGTLARLPVFALLTIAVALVYGLALALAGVGFADLGIAVVIAVVALQVGYVFGGVLKSLISRFRTGQGTLSTSRDYRDANKSALPARAQGRSPE